MISVGSLFRRQPSPLIGLDISASAVKLVELNQDGQGEWVLERCATEPLGSDWIVDGNIENFDEVADALRRLLKKSGTRAKNTALALPYSAVITKRIILPGSLSEQELEVQVESEASQYIPFPLDEVSLDFCVVGANAKNPSDVDVLLAATRKERVEERNNLAVLVGLNPVVMDVESYASRLAAGRWIAKLPNAGAGELIALVKVGARNVSLQIVRDDEVLHDSEQAFGGAQLTQMIARHYGVTVEEAELKKRTGDLPADYPQAVLQSFVGSLAQDIGRALQFFYTSTPYHSVQHVVLFGGTAGVAGLAEAVQAQTGVQAHVLNPFEGMKLSTGVLQSRLKHDASMYLTACGLAMRRFLS
ncbi:pilus assembly protein PilM [Comamonas aquatica]|uniref:pilus assembly protein PilM n=1 Tax=Comamonas aquatica TaxID=225991 RepID=UPI0024495AC3|nr:pilus assembly protein PilM [Comamonas aquatica]MDH0200273.1 pilus assembly protein PilM [Comamonas aquatica]MDH0898817.1 pilus assembly protein PilM [Comamonas aquatica]MDH1445237.1 pilus assembly protein PilM [Comamonas aquatica]